VVGKAVGERIGKTNFFASPASHGAYDGLVDTGRSGHITNALQLDITTIDKLWTDFGQPRVCAIKIDAEGAELAILRGARECLSRSKPRILIEWNVLNLRAHDVPAAALLEFANAHSYRVAHVPSIALVETVAQLELQMRLNETFILLPNSDCNAFVEQ
jgi:hypothetical protein